MTFNAASTAAPASSASTYFYARISSERTLHMSETEHDNQLQVSEEILEESSFDRILLLIRNGAFDAMETQDFLSYSTLLDVQLSEPSNYSIEEREKLLEVLLETLKKYEKLIYEIGWDLPSLILPFVESNHDFDIRIREIPGVYKVIKLFELLALHGNAKELFLKSNELLAETKLKIYNGKKEAAVKMYEVKIYCLLELIISSFRQIQTLYPSRFLSMFVSSFVSSLYFSPPITMDNFQFLQKRVYDFARNYTRPPLPDSVPEDKEVFQKIMDDEEYLQRKLLTAFITESFNLMCKHEMVGLSSDYFKGLQELLPAETRYASDYTLKQPVLDSLYELSQSFDMDLRKVFSNFIKSTDSLVVFPSGNFSDDDYRVLLFETLVADYQRNFAMSIVDVNSNEVCDSLHGSLTLFSYHFSTSKDFQLVTLSVKQAMALGLRVLVPGLIHENFARRGLHDFATFWMWFAIEQLKTGTRSLELEIATIQPIVLSTYLQCLMFVLVSSFAQSYLRFVTLTLLTRILSSAPEEVAYNLVINSLQDCPYENVKAALVQVLKSLLMKDKIENQLSELLNYIAINGKESALPPLPPRETNSALKYINLSPERFADIIALVDRYIELTFQTNSLNLELYRTLQAYLNLLIIIKGEKYADARELLRICNVLTSKISSIKESTKDDPLSAEIYNTAGILGVSVDRLSSDVSK